MQKEQGVIFNITHGSFVDGYGIRTTVFLKGCPLRCIWCCNPEGQNYEPELKVTSHACNGCRNCLEVCSEGAIEIDSKEDGHLVTVNRKLCTNCGKCVDVCFTGALDYFGRIITVDELFDIVYRDVQYYRSSGGGVTIGGGEPTFQPDFTYSLLQKCKENYLHIAMDTCGYTLTEKGLRILKEADLLLFDLKGLDDRLHRNNTGVSNKPILQNLKTLDSLGKAIIIRIPVIPGHTDSADNIQATAEFLSKRSSIERVDLIGYHEYGKVKYQQLGKECKLNAQPLTEKQLEDIKNIFERYGLKTQLGG